MSRSLFLQFVALALLVVAVASDLKIEVTHKPEDCDFKSQKGDKLSVQ